MSNATLEGWGLFSGLLTQGKLNKLKYLIPTIAFEGCLNNQYGGI